MNAEELIRILSHGEGPHVEFKSDFPKQADDISKEMAALANSGGGILLMGVADDGSLPGILNPDQVLDRLAGFARFLRVSPEIDKFQLSKKVFVVYALVHPCPPCFFRDRIYHRVGSSSEPCTNHEQLNKILSSHKSRKAHKSKVRATKRRASSEPTTGATRLPRTPAMFERGIIKAGDILTILHHEKSDAIVVDGSNVRYGGRVMSYNEWGQKVTGWVALNIYKWAALNGKMLGELRSKTG
ncbi:MAG: hypothetical protein QOF72_2166 [Blastocatellia bacterium]|jgi:hypothetical protein|nr:hypothetical protein [Blastocatellia bacterium]